MPKVLAFNGSLRADSWNYKLVLAAGKAAERAGAEVTYLHLNELPMPLFNEDLEKSEGMTPNGRQFKELLLAHDGLLVGSPEYNGSISAALKNALDWASRREGEEAPLACFKNKTALILATSPGSLGGLRGLVHARAILANLGVTVLPEQLALAAAHQQFNAEGALSDPKQQAKIEQLSTNLVSVCKKLYGP